MYEEVNDWTHKKVEITDIRKSNEFYIFTINSEESEDLGILNVKGNIFEDRLKPYFLKEAYKVSREEIMSVRWNMYITKGFYIKIHKGKAYPHEVDPNKYYISYLEIDGPLGEFHSIVCKDKEN